MKTTINCFLPFSRLEETIQTVKELRASKLTGKIYLLAPEITNVCIPGCELISVKNFRSTQAMKAIAARADGTYTYGTQIRLIRPRTDGTNNGNDQCRDDLRRPLSASRWR